MLSYSSRFVASHTTTTMHPGPFLPYVFLSDRFFFLLLHCLLLLDWFPPLFRFPCPSNQEYHHNCPPSPPSLLGRHFCFSFSPPSPASPHSALPSSSYLFISSLYVLASFQFFLFVFLSLVSLPPSLSLSLSPSSPPLPVCPSQYILPCHSGTTNPRRLTSF